MSVQPEDAHDAERRQVGGALLPALRAYADQFLEAAYEVLPSLFSRSAHSELLQIICLYHAIMPAHPWPKVRCFDPDAHAEQVSMDNVRRELEPGLGISRLSRDDYVRFLRLGAFFTAYVRGKQVCLKANVLRPGNA